MIPTWFWPSTVARPPPVLLMVVETAGWSAP
jgi:hypothetical protein